MSKIVLTLDGINPAELFGPQDSHLKLLRSRFPDVDIFSRGNDLSLSGEKKHTQKVKHTLEKMMRILKSNDELPSHIVQDLLNVDGTEIQEEPMGNGRSNIIIHTNSGQAIKAKTRNQKRLVKSSERADVVFAVGPAGTGKTYTAVALAVRALKHRLVKKIILTRPAVEAGESLGFLPGDLKDKIDPYLRPLYDALDDMFPSAKLKYFTENRIIEIAPLAYMRGRTLDNAFIILDEAQNATTPQMKMFLTRLGPNAKAIITGDISQIDLPKKHLSGLYNTTKILEHVDGIEVIRLTGEDVVRHRLVKRIIEAFEEEEIKKENHEKQSRDGKDNGEVYRRSEG